MTTSPDEATTPRDRIARALAQRCRIAGGVRAGFSLRRLALEMLAGGGQRSEQVVDAVDDLVSAGYLMANESGTRVYITEAGVAWLNGSEPAPDAPPAP